MEIYTHGHGFLLTEVVTDCVSLFLSLVFNHKEMLSLVNYDVVSYTNPQCFYSLDLRASRCSPLQCE